MPNRKALEKIAYTGHPGLVANIEAIARQLNELTTAAASGDYNGAGATAAAIEARAKAIAGQCFRYAESDRKLGQLIGVGTHPPADDTEEQHWWTRTPLRERRIILDESDLWDGNTYAERTWNELPAHIQKDLEATQKNRAMLGFTNEARTERCTCGIGDDLQSVSRHALFCPMRISS